MDHRGDLSGLVVEKDRHAGTQRVGLSTSSGPLENLMSRCDNRRILLNPPLRTVMPDHFRGDLVQTDQFFRAAVPVRSLGIPNTTLEASSWAKVLAPAIRMARSPLARPFPYRS